MKKIYSILLICLMFGLTSCTKSETTEVTTQTTSANSNISESTTENQFQEYIQEHEGTFFLFGKNSDDIENKEIQVLDEIQQKEYNTKQVSEDYVLQFYTDSTGNEKLNEVSTHMSLAIPIIDEYLKENKIEDLTIYRKCKCDDGLYRYVYIETSVDENEAYLIFYPKYSGIYIVGEKNNNPNYKDCNAKITNDKINNGINKTAYSICVIGRAKVEIYLDNKLVDTIATSEKKEYKEEKKNGYIYSIGDIDENNEYVGNTLNIKVNKNNKYSFKVIPTDTCEVVDMEYTFLNIATNSENISDWDTSYYDENTLKIINDDIINKEKIYKNY